MYTLYHMLSFILFIVPIFLIYLLPRLSPNTSSCSFRLCTAGYQKGVGKSTPGWRRGSASQHCCLCVVLPRCAPLEGGPAGKSWGTLGCVGVWTVTSHQPQVWRDPSTVGAALCPRSRIAGRAALVGWSWQCLTTQGCLTVEIKGNGPLGVRFEHLFWLRTSC